MRLLFVENRYTTKIWDLVAARLKEKGHEIFWIVQNHAFTPKTGEKFFLPYDIPPLADAEKLNDPDIEKIINIDRGIRYFGAKDSSHIYYYKQAINTILDKVKPDVAFGECTLSHELLTLSLCRNKGIPYFFPASSRFPVGRIAFFEYDTLVPFGGSFEKLEEDIALEMASNIGNRTIKPLSLVNLLYSQAPTLKSRITDRLKITKEYLKGERFNTPSVLRKLKLQSIRKENKEQWDLFALDQIDEKEKFVILYAMHMQPEANIDVWAYPKNNQIKLIQSLLDHTPENVVIVLKPNPSSHMELGGDMIDFVKSNKRLIPLKHNTKITKVIEDIDLVAALTGTIAMECVFSNKPVVTFLQSYFNKAGNCIYVDDMNDITEYISMVERDEFPKLTSQEMVDYLNWLNSFSYDGCTDASINPNDIVYHEKNISELTYAFEDLCSHLVKR